MATLPYVLATSTVQAHSGAGDASGLVHGLIHPVGGLDHLLAMSAVGILAAQLGGRALWIVPAAFMAMMVAGAGLGAVGVPAPFVEVAVAGTVIALGALVALGSSTPLPVAATLVGLFALFHGYAHGAELPGGVDALSYAAGFVLATALLHLAGILIARVVTDYAVPRWPAVTRLAALAISMVGVGLVVSAI